MQKLSREDLYSLEEYAEERPQFRAQVMAHKKHRHVALGGHATLYFEDRLTIQYQVQEMLRVERIFEAAGIQDELDAYNPLIPDGSNLKATFMIEYADESERRDALAALVGIEDKTWVRVAGFDKVYPIADEDLERDSEEKTSSVHFLRFELTPEMVQAAKGGAALAVGVEHENYACEIDPLPEAVRASLVADLG
ncbi:MAG: DUF3501 family protein [Gammaproteobacteria bacterium]